MDEILSSIKKIIADEDRARPAAPRRAMKAMPPAEQSVSNPDEILELTEAAEPAFDSLNASESQTLSDDGVLLDDNKVRGLRHSFSTLQTLSEPGAPPQIVRSGETSLEGLTRDLLRPMLKDWLESHLPGIVESMVEREIARITKKD